MWKIPKLFSKNREIVAFLSIIEFAHQTFSQLVQHSSKLVALTELGVVVDKFCDVRQGIEIFHHLLANVRALYFHGHGSTVTQPCQMYLSQRSRRHRYGFEVRKRLRYPDAEFRCDNLLDLAEAERLDFVL